MGNLFSSKQKKPQKKPKNAFERGKQEAQERLDEIQKNADPKNKRSGKLVPSSVKTDNTPSGYEPTPGLYIPSAPPDPYAGTAPPDPSPVGAPLDPSTPSAPSTYVLSYDDVALDNMRYQLNNDSNAFLLNNILLSVQFFENYEREMQQIKYKPINDGANLINDAMIRYNKHVFVADRGLENVNEHVGYQRSQGQMETMISPRVFVIHDNVEAREKGDNSNYSAALDAPFYKLRIEDSMKPGYLMLKKLEVLESTFNKETPINDRKSISKETHYADFGNEFNDVDDKLFATEEISQIKENYKNQNINFSDLDDLQSGPVKVVKENQHKYQRHNSVENTDQEEAIPKKSILKTTREVSATTRYIRAKERRLRDQNSYTGDESESSGYGSIMSGGSTTTESTISKQIQVNTKYAPSSGVLSDECWTAVVKKVDDDSDDEDIKESDTEPKQVKADNNWSDEDEMIDSTYKALRKYHDRYYYLNSSKFMKNFIINFKKELGKGLGFSQGAIRNATTYGASIYCDTFKDFLKTSHEIIPGLTGPWPNAANQWIIRERKIVQNPRNNYTYQWPVQYMVSKARDLGCVLVPVGYQPKGGSNPEQNIQWRITFPEAESYLDGFLAHSHMRCYLFTLALHKTFLENESMIGVDSSHIKNHLYWQCENNFAKWPEDRLGESLRSFLGALYMHFAKARLPNYFMERYNEFESIPASVLLLLQHKLKEILEAPVMHMLYAIDKLKYNSIGFYPTFNCQKLYDILTCKNPMTLSNPNLSAASNNGANNGKQRKRIRTNISLPKRLETERRHLVLKFFIPHFIAMARTSEKFDDINQAMIYLEHSQRLCLLLLDEPGGDAVAEEYLQINRDKLADCQRKKANQVLPRKENTTPSVSSFRRQRPVIERVVTQDTLSVDQGRPITIADIHVEQKKGFKTKDQGASSTTSTITANIHQQQQKESLTKDHGIPPVTFADIRAEEQQIQLEDNDIEESYL